MAKSNDKSLNGKISVIGPDGYHSRWPYFPQTGRGGFVRGCGLVGGKEITLNHGRPKSVPARPKGRRG